MDDYGYMEATCFIRASPNYSSDDIEFYNSVQSTLCSGEWLVENELELRLLFPSEWMHIYNFVSPDSAYAAGEILWLDRLRSLGIKCSSQDHILEVIDFLSKINLLDKDGYLIRISDKTLDELYDINEFYASFICMPPSSVEFLA